MAKKTSLTDHARQYLNMGMVEAAIDVLEKACSRNARDAESLHLLALALGQVGRNDDALDRTRRAIRLQPRSAALHVLLGNLLARTGSAKEAVQAYRDAMRFDTRHGPALAGLTLAHGTLNEWQVAIECGRQALATMPDDFRSHINLAHALRGAGLVNEATHILLIAAERFPNSPEVLDRLLPILNYTDVVSPEQALAFAKRYGDALSKPSDDLRRRPYDPARRLRIGFLSADMRTHSVAYFLEPIFEHLDRSRFEVIGYCDNAKSDQTTDRLRSLCDHWQDTYALAHAQLVERIREDAIDILIELAGHTNPNRLVALAHRCAPVQMTYLGYPGTTGVPAIDYRIVDAITDPPGSEHYASERLLRIEGCFLCYKPPPDAPAINPQPPVERNGFVTFGSFNSLQKYSDATLDAWASILIAVSGSRLLLKNKSLADPWVQSCLLSRFSERGIDPARLDLRAQAATLHDHLSMYADIDIAIDTLPYNGTTTTCEALWMGVPVLGFAGSTHPGRVGVSLLNAVGLEELIANDRDCYVRLAGDLAADHVRLASLRRTMRDRVAGSLLCDAAGFAARFEQALREAIQCHQTVDV